MKKIIPTILYCFLLFCSPSSKGIVLDEKELETKIDALIPAGINDSTPGLVIGIVQKGKLIFSKGYGLANISYGIPNDPKMVYNIGSVSKQFLGYAFAMLHVKGKLNIDDPVGKYLENWPEFKHKVTIRHLLSHTSGYREAYTLSILAGRVIGVDRLSRKECLDVVRNQPQLEFIPGSRHTYNSTAWVILAEILEKVTGQPADVWVKVNILKPLEMNDTQIENYIGEVIINAAESYSYDKDQGYKNLKSNRAIFGASDVYSSIDDMVKWINNLKTAEVGGKKVNDLFLKPFILNDGSNSEYAFGIVNGSYRGLKLYSHTGAHEAFHTQLSYFPDQDLGIIMVSNFGGKGWLAPSKIADLLLEKDMVLQTDKVYPSFEIKKEQLKQFEGLYLSSDFNKTLNFRFIEDTLRIGWRTKLTPVSHSNFRIKGDSNIEFKFKNISNNKTQLTIVHGQKDNSYFKVEKWTPDRAELSTYVGDFWSDELETVYHLIMKGNNLIIKHRWLGEVSLVPITNDVFKTYWGFYVKFNRDKDGKVSSLSANSGNTIANYGSTLNVIFHRKE